MIQSNTHLYQEINKIIAVLKQSGEIVYAKKLDDALSVSTVPSEVLGELRIVLLELNETKLLDELKVKIAVNDSLKYINTIL